MDWKKLWIKHKETILYLLFGGCTTLINTVVYISLYEEFAWSNSLSNVTAWIISVLFAFVTNKLWVFESRVSGKTDLLQEIVLFAGCRLATGAVDFVIMYAAVDLFGWHAFWMKCLANVIVIALNYAASKVLIFRKKDSGGKE